MPNTAVAAQQTVNQNITFLLFAHVNHIVIDFIFEL